MESAEIRTSEMWLQKLDSMDYLKWYQLQLLPNQVLHQYLSNFTALEAEVTPLIQMFQTTNSLRTSSKLTKSLVSVKR